MNDFWNEMSGHVSKHTFTCTLYKEFDRIVSGCARENIH